jgi:hypothetical protein
MGRGDTTGTILDRVFTVPILSRTVTQKIGTRMLITLLAMPLAAPMDVLMLAVDDLRPQLACFDVPGTVRPPMHTPNICNLAKDSLVLQRSQVSMATCSPSRTALLTGRHATSTHVWDLFSYFRDITGNFTTIPQYFKEQAGYSTYGMVRLARLDRSNTRSPLPSASC